MRGSIRIEGKAAPKASPAIHVVGAVSCEGVTRFPGRGPCSGPLVALVDCGAKNNILRCLLDRGRDLPTSFPTGTAARTSHA
jgi:carbamoylphosphate synthase small subunit